MAIWRRRIRFSRIARSDEHISFSNHLSTHRQLIQDTHDLSLSLFVGYLNDLWKFDGQNWTWISGSNLTNQQGNYGIQGISSSSNVPGSRYSAISWIDMNNSLWLFGGEGYDADGTQW